MGADCYGIVEACRVWTRIMPYCDVPCTNLVRCQRIASNASIVAAGGVPNQRQIAIGGIFIANGVIGKRVAASCCVAESGRIFIERLKSNRSIVIA
jgi:hypothetical protein